MNILESKNLPIEKYNEKEYRFFGKENNIISIISQDSFNSFTGLRFVDTDLAEDLRFKFITKAEMKNSNLKLTIHVAKNENDFLAKFNELVLDL